MATVSIGMRRERTKEDVHEKLFFLVQKDRVKVRSSNVSWAMDLTRGPILHPWRNTTNTTTNTGMYIDRFMLSELCSGR